MQRSTLSIATGVLTVLILGVSFFAWFQGLHGDMGKYDLFPLLGLWAFGLMWMHYISGSLKRYLGPADDTAVLKRYFHITSVCVLALILLHPALLYTGLFQDGFGLPPVSAWQAYGTTAARAGLILGSVSLTAFLLFELGRWFRDKKWWKYIEYANYVAMLMIFVHALLLGGELFPGWFRFAWIIIGWILVMSIIYNHWYDHKQANKGDQ